MSTYYIQYDLYRCMEKNEPQNGQVDLLLIKTTSHYKGQHY